MDEDAQDHLAETAALLAEQVAHLEQLVNTDRVDAVGLLRVTAQLEQEVSGLRDSLITLARADGCSWTRVGDALGVTRQAAWERHSIAPSTAALVSPLRDR